jgi:hypothetical protein
MGELQAHLDRLNSPHLLDKYGFVTGAFNGGNLRDVKL